MQTSARVSNAMLDAAETATGTAPTFRIYSGPLEANTAAAATGTLLASLAAPSDWMANAANRQKALAAAISGTAAAGGLAGHYRIVASDGTVDYAGLVSEPWAANKAYVVGQQVHLNNRVYVATAAGTSASSGGPTGTTTGIVDGGVTWNYAGPQEVTFDNTNWNTGQTLNLTSYTWTGPAA